MSVLFSGVIHVSGELDTGKTMNAFSCGAQPEDIIFVDDDAKGKATVDQIEAQGRKLGMYFDLISMGVDKKEVEFHNACIKAISEMEEQVKKRGKPFEALIWDTWSRFENTFHPVVVTNPGKYKSFWSPNGVIKGAEQWKQAFVLESEVLNRLLKIAKLVILTTHLKPETVGGKKTGKQIPDCKQPLAQKSLLRVYLRHNPDGPEPIGLILKRVSKQIVTENGIEIVSVLPRKMKPFTWERIRYYWDHPIGSRKLEPEEMPDEFELSILDGTLTEDQKWIMRLQETPTEDDVDSPVEYPAELVDAVKTERMKGDSLPVIAKAHDLTVPDVNKILSLQ